jgi:enamine deaminase RidA (YjgF/YER057c/UK114 family)
VREAIAKGRPLIASFGGSVQIEPVGGHGLTMAQGAATFANVVKTNYHLRDAGQVSIVREIRSKYFTKELPASTLVEVPRLAQPDFLIEIEAIAVLPP